MLARKEGKKEKKLKHHLVELIHHGVHSLECFGVCDSDRFCHFVRLIARRDLAIHRLSPPMIPTPRTARWQGRSHLEICSRTPTDHPTCRTQEDSVIARSPSAETTPAFCLTSLPSGSSTYSATCWKYTSEIVRTNIGVKISWRSRNKTAVEWLDYRRKIQ